MENQEIQLSLQQRKRKKFIHFVVKKSLNEPFPSEFGGRSKWDSDRLKPWKDLKGHGSLDMHLEAQFDDCFSLNMEKILLIVSPEQSTLDHVREIVRTIVHNFYYNSIYLFVVHTFCQQHQVYEPVFHLRLHQPVRISPQGTPFLLASVMIPNLLKNLKGKENTIRLLTNRITTEFLLRELPENFASFLHHRMKRTTYSVIIYAQILPKCVELPGNQRTFRGGNGVLGCQHSCRHFTRKTFNPNATKLVRILLLGMRLFVVKRIATAIDICAPPVLVRGSR